MNARIVSLNQLGERWFETMASVVVQGFVVFLIASVVARLLQRHSAALRFWVWQAAAIKIMIIPISMIVVLPVWPPTNASTVMPSVSYTEKIAEVEVGASELSEPQPSTFVTPPNQTLPKLTFASCGLTIWGLIVGLQLANCIRRKHKLSRMLMTCTSSPQHLQQRLAILSKRLRINRPVSLVLGDVQGPLVTGIKSPTIVLPSSQEFDTATFDQIALHELAHVQRRDLLWVWLPEILRMALFFYPPTYWIQRQAKLNSEIACDELVIALGSTPRAYATTLLKLL